MSLLSESTIRPFRGENTCIISPLRLAGDRMLEANSRLSHMRDLYDVLDHKKYFFYEGGRINIRNQSRDLVHSDDYWGGDGIWVTIPASYTGEDLSKALGEKYVVLDQNIQRHFVTGVEFFIDRMGACSYALRPAPANDHALSFDAFTP